MNWVKSNLSQMLADHHEKIMEKYYGANSGAGGKAAAKEFREQGTTVGSLPLHLARPHDLRLQFLRQIDERADQEFHERQQGPGRSNPALENTDQKASSRQRQSGEHMRDSEGADRRADGPSAKIPHGCGKIQTQGQAAKSDESERQG